MSDWTRPASHGREDPAERAAREAKHQLLIDLLGAYVDGELPPQTTSQIDAHLVGCTRCRRELALHHAFQRRLEAEPLVSAPVALRERILSAIAATPVPDVAPERRQPAAAPRRAPRLWGWSAVGVVVVAGAGFAIRAAVIGSRAAAPPIASLSAAADHAPLADSVLADYRRVTMADLPGRSRDLDVVRAAVPFSVDALRAPSLRLLAAWTTSLGGEPAAVLAYRWGDDVVLEYLVSEERFFHEGAIRRAVAGAQLLAISDGNESMLAWPTRSAGAFLVGDVPLKRLASLAGEDALARGVPRDAP